ncbi:MAG: substrate-binding domain-containing protein [Oscillospiraceae bacterium]|nr:substrate-binding domain-containing protein [Oscillospiraceae bacterium]
MKNGKRTLVLFLTLLTTLSGCAATKSTDRTSHAVTLVAKSTSTEFWKSVFAGANAAATEYNVELTIVGPDSEEDYTAQNDMIRQAVESGAEALVFSAISYEGNAPAIDEAAADGIAVVSIDSDVDSDAIVARIGTDNVDAGRKAAAAALDTDGDDLVIGLINYDVGSKNGQEREQGFREVAVQDPRVAGLYTVNTLATDEDAREQTAELLRQHPEINTLVAFNEPTSVGAALAIRELKCTGAVRMVGFDSNVKTIDMMQSGEVTALVVQNPYAMGYLGVETAYGALSGEDYDSNALIDTSTTIVTKTNMFEIENQKAMFSFN